MDDDGGLNMRNWGYYEPSNFKSHLGLQLMPTVPEQNAKPFFTAGRDHLHPHHHQHHQNPFMMIGNTNNNNNGAGFQSRDCPVSEPPPNIHHMEYLRDSWLNHQQREKFLNILPINPNFNVIPEPGLNHPMHQILQTPPDTLKDMRVDLEDPIVGVVGNETVSSLKKRNCNSSGSSSNPKGPKPKKSKKGPSAGPKENGNSSSVRVKQPKKSMDMNMVINGMNMDISSIPIPVCSCTGAVQQCYRWGCGGWQSACCTTTISTYPLPMSTKRRGARIAGRKMSQGAFKKVLEKLASEGYNFGNPIDLRNHWAKHGTNKFVTIR